MEAKERKESPYPPGFLINTLTPITTDPRHKCVNSSELCLTAVKCKMTGISLFKKP